MDLWGKILLLVEGNDELSFFVTYIHHVMENNPEFRRDLSQVQVIPLEGKEKFRMEFKALSSQSAFRNVVRIGIIQDADNCADTAFQSICSKLKSFGYHPPVDQLSRSDGVPSFVILINPADGKGMLEDIILDSFSRDPSIPCVHRFHSCLENLDDFEPPKNKSKAGLQTFLSSRSKYVKDIGVAARQGIIPFDHPAFDNFLTFFRLLTEDLSHSD